MGVERSSSIISSQNVLLRLNQLSHDINLVFLKIVDQQEPILLYTVFSLMVLLRVNNFINSIIREAGIIFQNGQLEHTRFFNSLETFNIIGLNLKRTFRRLWIRHCGNFPKQTKPPVQNYM